MDTARITQALQDVDPLVWVAIGAVVLLAIVALTILTVRRRRRRAQLRERYGAEYDHTARQEGSTRKAARDLLAREEHRRSYEVRELEAGERERLRARWEGLQASFVDGPETAVRGADDLIGEVASTKGYDTDGDPLRDVSVDHPLAVDRYRTGQAARTNGRGPADTEDLRRAMLASRDMFETLVGRERFEDQGASAAFRDLVREDEEAEDIGRARRQPADHGSADHPDDALAEGHTGEMPLYGPDGRPLGRETSQRRR